MKKMAHIKLRSGIVVAGFIMLLLFVLSAAINHHVHESAQPRIISSMGGMEPRDAAIVLGARVYRNGALSHALYDRVAVALQLYQQKKVRRLLLTGVAYPGPENEVAAMGNFLISNGVPVTSLMYDGEGVNTVVSMERAARLFGIKEAVVVTQRYHLPRALLCAVESDIDAVGYPADRRHYKKIIYFTIREFFATVKDYLLILKQL